MEIGIDTDDLVEQRFEDDMNILNLAIDQLRIKIVKWLSTNMDQAQKKRLVDHTPTGLKAIH